MRIAAASSWRTMPYLGASTLRIAAGVEGRDHGDAERRVPIPWQAEHVHLITLFAKGDQVLIEVRNTSRLDVALRTENLSAPFAV